MQALQHGLSATMKGLALFQLLLSLMHYGALVAQMLTNVDMGVCSYPHTPGIHKKEQIEAWKPVVKVRAALGAQFALYICPENDHCDSWTLLL